MALKIKMLAVLDAAKKMSERSTIGMYSSKISGKAIDSVVNKIHGTDPKAFEEYEKSDFAKNLETNFDAAHETEAEHAIRKTQHFLRIAGTVSTVASIPAMAMGPLAIIPTAIGAVCTVGDSALTITNEVISVVKTTQSFKEAVNENLNAQNDQENQALPPQNTDEPKTPVSFKDRLQAIKVESQTQAELKTSQEKDDSNQMNYGH